MLSNEALLISLQKLNQANNLCEQTHSCASQSCGNCFFDGATSKIDSKIEQLLSAIKKKPRIDE